MKFVCITRQASMLSHDESVVANPTVSVVNGLQLAGKTGRRFGLAQVVEAVEHQRYVPGRVIVGDKAVPGHLPLAVLHQADCSTVSSSILRPLHDSLMGGRSGLGPEGKVWQLRAFSPVPSPSCRDAAKLLRVFLVESGR